MVAFDSSQIRLWIVRFALVVLLVDLLCIYLYWSSENGHDNYTNFVKNITPTSATDKVTKAYKGYLPMVMFYWPIMTAALVPICLLDRSYFETCGSFMNLGKNAKTYFSLVAPIQNWKLHLTNVRAIYLLANFIFLVEAFGRHRATVDQDEMLCETANSFGILALVNMSFFLIPVSKHNPLLDALNISQENAIGIHQLPPVYASAVWKAYSCFIVDSWLAAHYSNYF